MKLYKISELKDLREGDRVYLKYLELPATAENDNFDGVCEVIVNNGEIMTTDGGINFYYSHCNSEYACANNEEFSVQVYEV